MAETQRKQMEYRFLGPTGLKVSLFSFGNWVTAHNAEYQKTQDEIFQKCWDAGVNFYDTAEGYGAGIAEETFATSIKNLNAPREDLVISTKIFWGKDRDSTLKNQVNRVGLSRKHIIEGTLNSLRRLQLDYADIIFCHRYDHETPVEEVVRAFNWLIENGKIMYWGTSEWSPENLKETFGECNRLGLIKPVADQCQYNLLHRERFETGYADLFDRYRYGTTTWSPLASGLLTGKYNQGTPEGSRFDKDKNLGTQIKNMFPEWCSEQAWPQTVEKLNQLEAIAKELGCSLTQFALAWVAANKNVSTCILGASSVSQLEQNLDSINFVSKITPDIEKRVNEILGNQPSGGFNWKTFQPLPPRR